MFIYSIRASTLRFLAFVLVASALLIGISAIGAGESALAVSDAYSVDYSKASTNEERIAFMREFGIAVEAEPLEEKSFLMPESFDRVLLGYNELQKRQGLDLSKYAHKRVSRYTYRVTNYTGEGEVLANLFVFRGRIVAADVSTADPKGFVEPLTLADREKFSRIP